MADAGRGYVEAVVLLAGRHRPLPPVAGGWPSSAGPSRSRRAVSPSTPPPEIDALIDEIRRTGGRTAPVGLLPRGARGRPRRPLPRIVATAAAPDRSACARASRSSTRESHFSPDRIPTATATSRAATRCTGSCASSRPARPRASSSRCRSSADVLRSTLRLDRSTPSRSRATTCTPTWPRQLDAVWERFAAWERGPVDSAAAVGDLRRRVEALEAAEQARRFTPPYTAAEFEAAFRGRCRRAQGPLPRPGRAGRRVGPGARHRLRARRVPRAPRHARRGRASGVELDPVLAAEDGRAGRARHHDRRRHRPPRGAARRVARWRSCCSRWSST